MIKLDLDFRSDIPLTNQIVAQIQHQLADGVLHPGDQLPTVRALALELRINFNTVARAYRILDEAGIISTQQGRGTFILEQPPPETSNRLKRESLQALARRYLNEARRLGFDRQQSLQIFQETADTWQETDSPSKTE
jgi:GntR family transcriptional regulator